MKLNLKDNDKMNVSDVKSRQSHSLLTYYPAIDFLRGLGALVILIWHYHHFYFEKAYFGPTNGYPIWEFSRQPFYQILLIPYHYGMWAVQFFWMLSGFVFAFVYLQKKVSAKNFLILRLSRLYPLHFISLIVIAGLQYLSLYTFGSFQILEINDLYHFILNLFYAQYWGFQEGYSFNSPSWSVSVEEIVYWGFWLIFIKLNIQGFGPIIFILLLAFIFYPIFGLYASAFLFFFGGVTIYYLHIRFSLRGNFIFALTALICAFIAALILKTSQYPIHKQDTQLFLDLHDLMFNLFFFFLFAFAIFLFALVDAVGFLPKNWNSFCKSVGSLTYSTYMLHLPVQVCIIMLCEYFNMSRNLFDNAFIFLAYMIIMITIGRASFVFVEQPAQSMLRKRFLTIN